jgi:predicted nucleic acid-binding protein
MKVVVDTSAVIAVVAGEAVKPRLIELTKDAIIVAPPSIDWEIGNAFSAMLKRGRLELEQAIEAIQVYQEIAIEIVEVEP